MNALELSDTTSDLKLQKVNTVTEDDNKPANANKKELNEVTDKEDNSLESVLSELKLSGRFHLQLYFLISLLALLTAPHPINYIFAVQNVNYRCKYEKCEIPDLSTLKQNSTIDYRCHKYELLDDNGTCLEDNFNVSTAAECTEWVYDDPKSFVAEFNLGCQDWKRTLVGTMASIGHMIGLLLMGPISDKIGRKKLIVTCVVIRGVIGISKSMATLYWVYIVLEMFESILGDTYSTLFTMAIEMVTKNDRHKIVLLLSICTTIGQIFLAVSAYYTPTWRLLLVSIYSPAILFFLYLFFMNESLRWLLSKGKKEEAQKIIRKAVKSNKVVMDDSRIANLNCEDSSSASVWTSIKDTLASKKLFIRLLICFSMWFTSLFSAFTLLINSVSLEGDKYVNFILMAISGTFTGFILFYLLVKFKRKGPLIIFLTLTGVFCTSQAFVPKGYRWLSALLYICGKICATTSLRISYLYTTELFPTHTRNTMLGLCSAVGRVASVVAPQTPLLLKYWKGLPTLIMGILSLMTATVVTMMPDTSEDVLPDNVKQAEALGIRQKDALGIKQKDKDMSHF